MSELQERRDAQTRAELSTIAMRLFADQGFTRTTMAEVASAAGLSRRTAYRHYPNKEDLIFEHPRLWLELFHEVIARRTADQSTKEICSAAVLEVTAAIVATKEDVQRGYGIVLATPALRSRYARTNRDWLDAYHEVIVADLAHDDQAGILRASILAGALVGGTDRAAINWFLNPDSDLVQLVTLVLESVAPLWPKQCQ